MSIQTVFRDSNGVTINIGSWDYMEQTIVDDLTGEISVVQNNPLPEGATSSEEEISTLSDGGLVPTSDITTT